VTIRPRFDPGLSTETGSRAYWGVPVKRRTAGCAVPVAGEAFRVELHDATLSSGPSGGRLPNRKLATV